ncbi:MAG: tRNA-(ms[2]io[6]A)-hydroxylase, partial [Deltaproteobacteria bacterium]
RSAERLALLAGGLAARGEAELAAFYEDLAQSEVRHRDLFASLARSHGGEAAEARAAVLSAAEATLVAGLPWGPRIH